MPVVFGLCEGKTATGAQCRGMANVTGYCPNHLDQAPPERRDPKAAKAARDSRRVRRGRRCW